MSSSSSDRGGGEGGKGVDNNDGGEEDVLPPKRTSVIYGVDFFAPNNKAFGGTTTRTRTRTTTRFGIDANIIKTTAVVVLIINIIIRDPNDDDDDSDDFRTGRKNRESPPTRIGFVQRQRVADRTIERAKAALNAAQARSAVTSPIEIGRAKTIVEDGLSTVKKSAAKTLKEVATRQQMWRLECLEEEERREGR